MANFVDMDQGLDKLVRKLQQQLDEDDWMLPDVEGNIEDPEVLAAAIKLDPLNTAVARAISDPSNPGSVSDMIAGPLQVDLLQSIKRALLFRHCYPWNRCDLLATGRDRAQAKPQGPLAVQLDYLQNVMKQGKGEGQA